MTPRTGFRFTAFGRNMSGRVPALLLVALAACAGPRIPPPDPTALLRDDAFQPSRVPSDFDVFAVSPAMRRFLDVDIAVQLRRRGKLHGLIEALQTKAQLKLQYDATRTRTAAETFAARSGNCLSLTVMTAAFARELDLPVTFRQVYAEDSLSRLDRIVFSSGHINIALGHPFPGGDWKKTMGNGVIVDFLPQEDVQSYHWREISENRVSAMFMNNRAAETMVQGDLDAAYGWARAAILRDPRFLKAYDTLAVVYLRHGELDTAETVLREILAREPESVAALSNLAAVLERQGRPQAARAVLAALKRIDPYQPFHFFDLGQAALRRADYASAREYFARELRHNADNHEVLFGLAVAELGLRDARAAERYLAAARDASPNRRDREIYAAKLAWLRARMAQ